MSYTKWFGTPKGGKPSKCDPTGHVKAPCTCSMRGGVSVMQPNILWVRLTALGWKGVTLTVDGKVVQP